MKEKIFKILHVVGYISMALLTLIFVLVGVNGCNNKEIYSEDIKQREPLKSVETYDDRLLITEETIGDYHFVQYQSIEMDIDTMKMCIVSLANNFNTTENIGVRAFNLRIVGINNGVSTVFTNTNWLSYIDINYATSNFKGFAINTYGVTIEQWTLDLSGNTMYEHYSAYLQIIKGDYKTYPDFFKYFYYGGFYDDINQSWAGSFQYIIPPYLTIERDTEPFHINLGFYYNDNYYYGITYSNGNLMFLATNGDNTPLEKKYSLNGEQYIFSSVTEYISDNRIWLVAFGTYGYEWLESNLINNANPTYNGTYYFNEKYLFDYIHRTELESSVVLNYPLIFYSNGSFFTNIIINILSMDNSDSVLVHLIYSNNGVKDISIIYKYFSLSTLQWEQRDTDILKKEYYTIELNNTLLTSENYSLFRTFYYVEYIQVQNNNDSGYIGNVFVLIGDSFSSILPILSISILPGLTIGVLIFIPLVISLVLFVVWLFKR